MVKILGFSFVHVSRIGIGVSLFTSCCNEHILASAVGTWTFAPFRVLKCIGSSSWVDI